MRSLAAESDRAYQNGPLERSFYQEASLRAEEGGVDINLSGFQLPSQYTSRLDWFAVDLEGEHSAMDGAILEEHTEYVVYAIHKVSLLLLIVYIQGKKMNIGKYNLVVILTLEMVYL